MSGTRTRPLKRLYLNIEADIPCRAIFMELCYGLSLGRGYKFGRGTIPQLSDQENPLLAVFLERREALHAMVAARLGDRQDARDILHDAWLRLSAIKQPKRVDNPSAYVVRTTQNVMKDHIRRANVSRRHVQMAGDLPADIPAAQSSPEIDAYHRARLRQMRTLLGDLSPKCQTAFLLSRCDGLSYRDIGDRMGISDNMVKKYLVKALAHLRAHMQPAGDPADRA